MFRSILYTAAAIVLSGCSWWPFGKDVVDPIDEIDRVEVGLSVAQQALGTRAMSVNPFTPSGIDVPSIYKIELTEQGRESYTRVCIGSTNRLLALNTTSNRVATELSDFLQGERVAVALPGVALSSRYDLQTVNGYDVEYFDASQVTAETGDIADFLISQVSQECRDQELANLGYYFVVVGVARSQAIRTESKGGVEIEPFSIGGASINIQTVGRNRAINQERVFAIAGKMFRNGQITSHGSFDPPR